MGALAFFGFASESALAAQIRVNEDSYLAHALAEQDGPTGACPFPYARDEDARAGEFLYGRPARLAVATDCAFATAASRRGGSSFGFDALAGGSGKFPGSAGAFARIDFVLSFDVIGTRARLNSAGGAVSSALYDVTRGRHEFVIFGSELEDGHSYRLEGVVADQDPCIPSCRADSTNTFTLENATFVVPEPRSLELVALGLCAALMSSSIARRANCRSTP